MKLYIFIIAIMVLSVFGIAKFVIYKMNTNSIKRKTSKKNSFVLQGGVIGLCLGVGVGTALKDLFSYMVIISLMICGCQADSGRNAETEL